MHCNHGQSFERDSPGRDSGASGPDPGIMRHYTHDSLVWVASGSRFPLKTAAIRPTISG
jgi:hypothetical protein